MNLRPFELGLIVLFSVLIIVSLFLLRTYNPPAKEGEVIINGQVTIWGVLPQAEFAEYLRELTDKDYAYNQVVYYQILPENFDTSFVEAIADQRAPDLLLISHEQIVRHRTRLRATPYSSFPERDFRNQYIDGSDIFLLPEGVLAFPLGVDPLLLFYNRTLLADSNFLTPPRTWEQVVSDYVPTLTRKDLNNTIQRPAIALGEYDNIRNSYAILSALLLQGGSAGITIESSDYVVRIDQAFSGGARPLLNSVNFLTSFSRPSNTLYTWNTDFPRDRDHFISENLSMYFGFASEATDIRARNPNLNFDITEIPQSAAATVRRTYGQFYGFSIPNQAKNPAGATQFLQLFLNPTQAQALSVRYNLAPVHRVSLQAGSDDIFGRVTYQAAPSARAWLNPSRASVDAIFTTVFDEMRAGKLSGHVVSDALRKIQSAY